MIDIYDRWQKNLICKSAFGTVLASHGIRHSAVYVWNNLPDNIREARTCEIFKRKLKTHLCELALAPSGVGAYE